jgi:hypothetical protein
VVLALR